MSQPTATNAVSPMGGRNGALGRHPNPESLADVLERVLDKGVVIVGDIGVSLLDIELLTLRIRLLIASADTAREMGIDWWTGDPFYSGSAQQSQEEIRNLRDRIAELEAGAPDQSSGGSNQRGSKQPARQRASASKAG